MSGQCIDEPMRDALVGLHLHDRLTRWIGEQLLARLLVQIEAVEPPENLVSQWQILQEHAQQ